MSGNAVLILDDNEYRISTILKCGVSGPTIIAADKELDLAFEFVTNNGNMDDSPTVLFFQRNNKTVVLAGRNKVLAGIRTGHLVSKVLLKRARIDPMYDAASISTWRNQPWQRE